MFTLEILKELCRDHQMIKKGVENINKLKTRSKMVWFVGFYGISTLEAKEKVLRTCFLKTKVN